MPFQYVSKSLSALCAWGLIWHIFIDHPWIVLLTSVAKPHSVTISFKTADTKTNKQTKKNFSQNVFTCICPETNITDKIIYDLYIGHMQVLGFLLHCLDSPGPCMLQHFE